MAQRWQISGIRALLLAVLATGLPVSGLSAAPMANAKASSVPVHNTQLPDRLQAMAFQVRQGYAAGQVAELEDVAEQTALGATLEKARSHFRDGAVTQGNDLVSEVLTRLDALHQADAAQRRLMARAINLIDGVEAFDEAYLRNAERLREEGRADAVRAIDRNIVDGLLTQAADTLRKGALPYAIERLAAVQTVYADTIRLMLEHQSLGEPTAWLGHEDEMAAHAKSQLEREQEDYVLAQKAVASFKTAYQRNVDHLRESEGEQAVVSYDSALLDWMEAQATDMAARGKLPEAALVLKRALNLPAQSLRRMLDNRKYTVKLDLSTPEKEYQYELNQYLGYDELIPVAIRRMQPTPERRATADRLVELGHRIKEDADVSVSQRDYPMAIRLQQDATSKIQQALRVMGVPVFTSADSHRVAE